MTIYSAKTYLDMPQDCEWCQDRATFKIVAPGNYRRYACSNVWHRDKLRQLARLDGKREYSEVLSVEGFKRSEDL